MLFATRTVLNQILIDFCSAPCLVNCHRSIKRSDWVILSCRDKSSLILTLPSSVLALENSRNLSMALLHLTSAGRGYFECSLNSTTWSCIDKGLKLPSVLVTIEITLFKSCLSLSCLGVHLLHYFIP